MKAANRRTSRSHNAVVTTIREFLMNAGLSVPDDDLDDLATAWQAYLASTKPLRDLDLSGFEPDPEFRATWGD